MKKQEAGQLERVDEVLGQIPRPAIGSQSSTVNGYVAYAADMEAAIPWIRKAIRGIVLQGRSDLEEGYDYENPDRVLEMISRWVNARKASDWELPVPRIEDFA